MNKLDSSFERSWRQRFERFGATKQDDAAISGWSRTGLEARLRQFQRSWTAAPGGLWLDAGCGPGTYSRYLLENRQRVVGLDYSLPSLKKAASRSPATVAWAAADVQRLPFQPLSFDGILCFGVLQALARPDDAVAELASMLRPGAWLWIDALNDWCLLTRWKRWLGRKRIHPMRYDSPARLRALLERHGLRDVALDWVPIAPASWPRLQRFVERPSCRRILRTLSFAGASVSHGFVLRARRPAA